MSRYLLDTTVLIAHLRGDESVAHSLLALLQHGDSLCVSCVNIAEIERGLRPSERRAAEALLDRMEFLTTTREAAEKAGRYQSDWAKKGKTVHLADALIAGTARAHGAVLVTDNVTDFPMKDVRVIRPAKLGTAE
ncbi:MAG TPA: type II toxin-antitoxin system VapC family toxin [Actinomycetota bacterium]